MPQTKIKDAITDVFKTITSKEINTTNTFMIFDTEGNLIIEGNNSNINYAEESISLCADKKNIYIYGENLKILSCSKSGIHIAGRINRIELFEVK